MEQLSATTSFELDRRRQKKDGTYTVKMLVIFNRKFKRYQTPFSLDSESFNKVLSPKPRGEFKDVSIKLNALEEKANKIIKKLEVFSYEAFEKKFLVNKNGWNNVFNAFDQQKYESHCKSFRN